MKIQYKFRGLNPRVVTDRPMDRHLEHLDRLIPISLAQVVLERAGNAAPAFGASVALAVWNPGLLV